MPHNYGSRLILIACVLIFCLFGFPGIGGGIIRTSELATNKPWSQKVNLKPGIDIAGGTSLTYDIKAPPGSSDKGSGGETLAEKVAAALKKRVDPQGVLNLVWRPQGDNRLEIQIPRSPNSGERDKAQKALIIAQQELKETNVSVDDVRRAIESPANADRDARLAELSGGSNDRLDQYKALATLHDEIEKQKAAYGAAEKANDTPTKNAAAQAQAEAEIKYDKEQQKLETANLPVEELNDALGLPGEAQKRRLDEITSRYGSSPARQKAIEDYKVAYLNFQKFKNSLDDSSDLKRMLRGSGVLEFHILVDGADLQTPAAQAMIERLHTRGTAPQANDTMRWYVIDNPSEFKSQTFSIPGDDTKRYALAYVTSDRSMIHRTDRQPWALASARPNRDGNGNNIVDFEFDAQGAKLFSELTRNNIKSPLAIVLDERMISAPNINSEIGARGQISGGGAGGFDPTELKYLVNTLSAGSLPASLADEPISERTVSPQLGVDNLYRGLIASFIGVVVVGVFLIGYYYLAGLVAFFAVVMNLIIILGVLCMFGATFTMPSIAGIILTIGTAVDANVLVFERMREEEHRGFPLKLALQHAYDRAFSAIVDSNMTTIITSLCLYFFGSEEVRGFGLTLVIGITSSLFTALFVTKTIFAILIDKYGIKELGSIPTSFPKWDKLLKPDIDWMGLIWPFIAFSTIFTLIGVSAFFIKKRDMFDIEFASGTAVQFELKHDMSRDEIDKLLSAHRTEIPSPSIVSLNGRLDSYEVVTPSHEAAQVRDAVLAALGTNLKIELPSRYEQFDVPAVDQAIGKAIIPIEKDTLTIDGKNIPSASNYTGGAAIVLRNLTPPISADDIALRLDRASTAPGSETSLSKFRLQVLPLDTEPGLKIDKEALKRPVKEAVVLVAQPDFPYAKSPEGWKDNVAAPLWKLTREGVGREAKLQKVSNFDPQVAGDTQRDALLATIVSIIVIMVYIWFRFGDIKFATATVVALVHDTVIVIGAVGISHYLDNGVGRALLVEPFRINLTLVAAILTVMGYSMIDTIVVFDRIRENRGRYGHLTRKVINDSINQTLSRTLLTAGATLITVSVMYICGGSGIHGFTFVLLVGILVGTYSSIAIASPILLIGSGKETQAAGRQPPVRGVELTSGRRSGLAART